VVSNLIKMDPGKLLPQSVNEPVKIFLQDTDVSHRKQFISQVYTTLWFQLVYTSIFVGLCNKYEPLSQFMKSQISYTIYSVLSIALFISLIIIFCGGHQFLQKKPYDWAYLFIFTNIITYSMGIIGSMGKAESLLLAGGITIAIFTGLTLYAYQTKIDYTHLGNYLIASLFGFIVFGFLLSFTTIPFPSLIYPCIGSIIFSFYIIFDTQLIIGGKHLKYEFSTDDYVLACISLYLDIINLFLSILDIIDN